MDVNLRSSLEFLRRVGVEGVKGESDHILEKEIDDWVELEKKTEKLSKKAEERYLEQNCESLAAS
jgi:hypothetical protein